LIAPRYARLLWRVLEFLRHAEKAGEKFGVDAREILTESAGAKRSEDQEDMIIEVAFRALPAPPGHDLTSDGISPLQINSIKRV